MTERIIYILVQCRVRLESNNNCTVTIRSSVYLNIIIFANFVIWSKISVYRRIANINNNKKKIHSLFHTLIT